MNTSETARLRYQEMVKDASPKSKIASNCLKAFLSGGFICCVGQFITNAFQNAGLAKTDAGTATSICLILISAVLTGFGVYPKLGKHCGAGTIVPITGFANSVVSPAIEFKKEGWVLGLGAKMFTVAGPVIVYGLLSSVLVGAIYYFVK